MLQVSTWALVTSARVTNLYHLQRRPISGQFCLCKQWRLCKNSWPIVLKGWSTFIAAFVVDRVAQALRRSKDTLQVNEVWVLRQSWGFHWIRSRAGLILCNSLQLRRRPTTDTMAEGVGDDELDDILDGALEAFEKTNESGVSPQTNQANAPDRDNNAERQLPSTDEDKRQKIDEADRALENALNSLSQAGLVTEGKGADDKVIDADIKLVEEFIRGLASTLGTADNPTEMAGGPSVLGTSPETDNTRQAAERFVDSIVGSLLSEDVLKKPMMEMSVAYEKWLNENAGNLAEEELRRYREQQGLIKKICDKYEAKADSSEIMDLLSKVHGTGEPPPEVIKSLDAGGDDGLPKEQAAELDKLADQCGVQ